MADDLRDLLQSTDPGVDQLDLDALHGRGMRRRRARRLAVPAAAVAGATVVVLAVVGIGGAVGPVVEDEPVSRPGSTVSTTPGDEVDEAAVVVPTVPDGMREEERGWELVAVSPDRTRLVVQLVDVNGCGVALRRASVDASNDTVTVRTFITVPEGDAPCAAAGGLPLQVSIDLDEPLDERDLTGCGRDDCRQLGLANEGYGAGGVDDELVVRSRPGGLEAFALDDGGSVWSRDTDVRLEARRDELLVARAPRGDVVRLDHDTGEERWRVFEERYGDNSTWVADEVVLVQDRVVFDVLYALDVDDGSLAWTLDLPDNAEIGNVVVTDRGDVLVGASVEGVPEILRLDADSGAELGRLITGEAACAQFPQGDGTCFGPFVEGGSLIGAVGERGVVLQPSGTVQLVEPDGGIVPDAVVNLPTDADDDGVLIVVDEGVEVVRGVAVDTPPGGARSVRIGGRADMQLSVVGRMLVANDRARVVGVVLTTSRERWELDLRQPPPEADGTATVLGRAPGITFGIDGATGAVVWWRPNELGGDPVPIQRGATSPTP